MNKYESETIVNSYGGAIAKGTIKRSSWLPCSKGKIKQAYFVYIDAIISDHGYLPKDMGEQLAMTYSMLNMFVNDDKADRLEKTKSRIDANTLDLTDSEDKQLVNEYLSYQSGIRRDDGTQIGGLLDGDLFDEINEFIGDCLDKNTKV